MKGAKEYLIIVACFMLRIILNSHQNNKLVVYLRPITDGILVAKL